MLPIYLPVGMTRFELATSRPPDVHATNCATSRNLFLSYFHELNLMSLIVKNFDVVGFNHQIREFSSETSGFHDVVVNPMIISAPWFTE